MNNLEKKIEALKKEESKGSRLAIPQTLLDEITKYQEAWKRAGNGKVSREDVIWRMMLHGVEGLKGDRMRVIEDMVKELK